MAAQSGVPSLESSYIIMEVEQWMTTIFLYTSGLFSTSMTIPTSVDPCRSFSRPAQDVLMVEMDEGKGSSYIGRGSSECPLGGKL